jgi:hypothetical protein
LRNSPVLLLQQSEEDVFGVHLRVSIAAHYLIGAGGRILGPFRKTIKSHGAIVLSLIPIRGGEDDTFSACSRV